MKALSLALFPLVGFGSGWIAGRLNAPAPPPRATSLLTPSGQVGTGNPSAETKTSARQAAPKTVNSKSGPASLREVLGFGSDLHRLGAFGEMLKGLSPSEFAALHEQLWAFRPRVGPEIRVIFFSAWGKVAPEPAVQAALLDYRNGRWEGFDEAVQGWVERAPEAVKRWLEHVELPAFVKKKDILDRIAALNLPKPGQFPPAEAFARIRQAQGDSVPSNAIWNAQRELLREWSKSDPEAAWRAVTTMPGDGHTKEIRQSAIGQLLFARGEKDPEEAVKWLRSLNADDRTATEAIFLTQMSYGGKTKFARDYALGMPEGPERLKALGGVAQGWITKDPEAAIAFVNSLPSADWREPGVFSDFFRQWMMTEPERAVETLAAKVPPDAKADDQQAIRFMVGFTLLKDAQLRCDLAAKLPASIRDPLLDAMVGGYCSQDAASAGAWAVALPQGSARDRALGQISAYWGRQDAAGAAQWLNSLPADSGKDAAIENFARQIVSTSPDDALVWLRAVPDEGERMKRMRRVWQAWGDRAAAQRWMENARTLTPAERTALQR